MVLRLLLLALTEQPAAAQKSSTAPNRLAPITEPSVTIGSQQQLINILEQVNFGWFVFRWSFLVKLS